jgi:hypothetical protein
MGLLAYLKTQFVVHLLIGFVFVVSGLTINFTQLCTLALWPISKQLYRRVNCRLAYSLWSREYLQPAAAVPRGAVPPASAPRQGCWRGDVSWSPVRNEQLSFSRLPEFPGRTHSTVNRCSGLETGLLG